MSLLEVFNNPSMLHAAVVHMPIALGMAGMVLVYVCAVVAKENEPLRWVTVGCYALMSLFAFLAAQSGQGAIGKAPTELPQAIWDQMERHEDMGEVIWKLAAITAALMALSAVKIRWFNTSVLTLAMLASLGTGAWVAITGHYGGTLVYEYGVGTPAMQYVGQENVTAAPPPQAPDPASFAVPAPDDGFLPPLLPFTMDEAKQVSYARQIQPLLKDVCNECHRPGKTRSGLDVMTVQTLLQGGKKAGPAIIPGNPDASPIIKYLRGAMQPRMPKGEEPLEADEVRLVRMWIAAGAVDDSAAQPPLELETPAPDAAASVPDKAPQSEETSGPAEAPATDATGSTPAETPAEDAAKSSPAEATSPDAASSDLAEAPSPYAASTTPSETPAPPSAAESEANP